MQCDHVLKKFNFYLLTKYPRDLREGGLHAKYLLHVHVPCCCIHDSLYFDKQHDHVLKKLTIDRARGMGLGVCRQNICYHVAAFRDSF